MCRKNHMGFQLWLLVYPSLARQVKSRLSSPLCCWMFAALEKRQLATKELLTECKALCGLGFRGLGACGEKLSWTFFSNKGSNSDAVLALVPKRAGFPDLPN